MYHVRYAVFEMSSHAIVTPVLTSFVFLHHVSRTLNKEL